MALDHTREQDLSVDVDDVQIQPKRKSQVSFELDANLEYARRPSQFDFAKPGPAVHDTARRASRRASQLARRVSLVVQQDIGEIAKTLKIRG